MIIAHISSEKIHSTSQDSFSLYEKSRFGEKVKDRIEYSWVEALFLASKNKLTLNHKNKEISFDKAISIAKRHDKRIETKLILFENLREKGYIVKTALKFGADFRVYKKGSKPGEDHALWLAYVVRESEPHTWHDFAAKNRVAHSTKKKLLIGIVDDENDVTYYEVSWLKP
ncbi:tRNA-intron lyase [Candidatus Pacearchaeota archaeon]|nr:tRNA-intron lyase [Candidatus Pacearchaeota archaeon]